MTEFKVGETYKSRDGEREYTVIQILDNPDNAGYSIVASYIDDGLLRVQTFSISGSYWAHLPSGANDSDMMPNIPKPKFKVGDVFYNTVNEFEVRHFEFSEHDDQFVYTVKSKINGMWTITERSLSLHHKLNK